MSVGLTFFIPLFIKTFKTEVKEKKKVYTDLIYNGFFFSFYSQGCTRRVAS